MVDTASLAKRARTSEDGEAYVPVARGPGYRLGMGARSSTGRDLDFFVEVVVDPFPDRPEVNASGLAEQAALVERLRNRGYAIACDDSGVITCERTMGRTRASKEARELREQLKTLPRTRPLRLPR